MDLQHNRLQLSEFLWHGHQDRLGVVANWQNTTDPMVEQVCSLKGRPNIFFCASPLNDLFCPIAECCHVSQDVLVWPPHQKTPGLAPQLSSCVDNKEGKSDPDNFLHLIPHLYIRTQVLYHTARDEIHWCFSLHFDWVRYLNIFGYFTLVFREFLSLL